MNMQARCNLPCWYPLCVKMTPSSSLPPARLRASHKTATRHTPAWCQIHISILPMHAGKQNPNTPHPQTQGQLPLSSSMQYMLHSTSDSRSLHHMPPLQYPSKQKDPTGTVARCPANSSTLCNHTVRHTVIAHGFSPSRLYSPQ